LTSSNFHPVKNMQTARLFKTATCLSLTLLSALLPALQAVAQKQDVTGVWTPTQGQVPGAPNNAGSQALPPVAEPVIEPYKAPALIINPDGTIKDSTKDAIKEQAKLQAQAKEQAQVEAKEQAQVRAQAQAKDQSQQQANKQAQPFSSVKDPLVTHPGSDDNTTQTGSVDFPVMVAPVFKPGSKAAIDQENMKAEAKVRQNQPMKLFGRIEQLTGSTGASFPVVFKAMTPQMDNTPGKKLTGKVGAEPTVFSGNIAKSFPTDFRGNWGGTLKVWTVVQDPICYKIDPVEASKLAKIFKSGAEGQVNFQFAKDTSGGIYVAPAQVMFQESGADAGVAQQMSQMMGGQSFASMGPMGAMMQQMAATMPVPVIFSFGDIQSSSMAKGLSGNEFVQRTMRNTTRQLAPNVFEQDVVAESNEIMKATGQPRKRYSESVLRFTKLNEQQMYVQAAAVTYGPNKGFQDKIIMYGTVTKGTVAQTNPYAGIMGGQMPGGGQIPGGGSIFGGGGNGQTPQMPDMDMIKKMFGQ
jgi:hypothetical protein